MLLHNKLLECFPVNSIEKVEIEIGYLRDLSTNVVSERVECELDINQFVALIEEKIGEMSHIPTIKVYYPFGIPKILTEGQEVVSYEQNFIDIKFK
jgi:hypothetical protein